MTENPASKTPRKSPGKTPHKTRSLKLDPAVVADLFAPAPVVSAPQAPAPVAPASKPAVPAPEVMVAAVRDYAMQYYNDGWDFVVECWTDADIAKTIVGAKSEKGAIRKVWHVVSEQIAHRKEVQAA